MSRPLRLFSLTAVLLSGLLAAAPSSPAAAAAADAAPSAQPSDSRPISSLTVVAVPPFPELWEGRPLAYPYADDPSLFLRPIPQPGTGELESFAAPSALKKPLRVLLDEKVGEVTVLAPGPMRLWSGSAGRETLWEEREGFSGKATFRFAGNGVEIRTASGLRRLERADAWRLWPKPGTGPFTYAGKPYRGGLEVRRSGGMVINAVPMETYLRGVLPFEIGRRDSTAFAALEAQAVVARTYALRRQAARQGQPFDVYADVKDQVYGGAEGEYPLADSAVAGTRGWLLAYRPEPGPVTVDDLAETYYHSTCGGMTAAKHEAWGGAPVPYLAARPDRDSRGQAYCAASSFSQWTRSWDASALASIVRRHQGSALRGSDLPIRRIQSIRVLRHFSCGRIAELDIDTDAGHLRLRGDKTRWALRPGDGNGRILESARFRVSVTGGKVEATGSGFGHGIGLCQMGALGRAAAGQDARQILEAYFPGTRLVRLE